MQSAGKLADPSKKNLAALAIVSLQVYAPSLDRRINIITDQILCFIFIPGLFSTWYNQEEDLPVASRTPMRNNEENLNSRDSQRLSFRLGVPCLYQTKFAQAS